MIIPKEEQFSGCLIGQCLGDALGFPVEGYQPYVCREYIEKLLRPGSTGRPGRGVYPFGQYTDDSQLARELMQSYAECRRFSPDDYAVRIAAIFREDRIVGRGRATEEAAMRLMQGVPWEESGSPYPSAGNGSAMRAGPIGLFYFNKPRELVRAAYDQGRITHQDKRCSAGAVAVAGAVALVLRQRPVKAHDLIDKLSEWTKSIDDDFASFLQRLNEWLSLSPEKAVKHISTAGMSHEYSDRWRGISPFVIGSVLWSLYSFLRSPEDYIETIRTSIAVGGDVDTTAAMAGAISGAYLGLDAIPSHLSRLLTDRGAWGYGELVELAHRCYEVKMIKIRKTKS
jgi:ADP-ribosylglycohydrolase